MKSNKISPLSRTLLIIAAISLIASLFVPIWAIYLDAPQYPEGLGLQIWANKIAGDVDIINGLNHYIGMKTLHTDDFIEFKILPYVIGAFAIFFLLVAFLRKKGLLYAALISFVIFGIVAMVDFWLWEYDYGHNLDPAAAIKVPGMAYQPPLIGFKQLLNFGAYSIPDIGGWLFIGAGLLVLVAVIYEIKLIKKAKKTVGLVAILSVSLFLSSCGSNGPEPMNYNQDACDFCKMSISESKFAAQLQTKKGRVYKFDDLSCMLGYTKTNENLAVKNFYIGNFTKENNLIDATTAFYVKSEAVKSPMSGNVAAFPTKEAAEDFAQKNQTTVISWGDLNK